MRSDSWRAEPGYVFRRMQQVAVAVFAEECAEFDVTCLQYAALARIRERPGIDATRLADVLDLDRSTIGGVIERLELKELIRRSSAAVDRRVKCLTVTESGLALLARLEPRLNRVNRRVLRGLDSEERKTLLGLMSRLIDNNLDVGRATQPMAVLAPRALAKPASASKRQPAQRPTRVQRSVSAAKTGRV